VQPVVIEHRRDWRNLDHLMAQWFWILSSQQHPAAATGIGLVLHHLIHSLDRQRLRPGSGMARLAASLAATALAPFWRLETRAIAGGRFGGVARAAADSLPQVRQLGGQGGELVAEFVVLLPESLNLLLLSQDQLSGTCRPRQPVRIWNPSRRCAHHRKSLPEMQAGIKMPSRVKRGQWACRAISLFERVLHVHQVSVLKIFQSGHGVRPDWFQLAMIKGLDYHHYVCSTESAMLHCRVPPQLLRQFLEKTL
jgi:hypothetical protein